MLILFISCMTFVKLMHFLAVLSTLYVLLSNSYSLDDFTINWRLSCLAKHSFLGYIKAQKKEQDLNTTS